MKGSDVTRAIGAYGQPGGGPRIIRVRGVEVSTDTFVNYRLKWTGSAYTPTTEVVTFFEPTSLVSKQLGEDEEAWVMWREASDRWEELAAGDSTGDQIVHFELTQNKGYADEAKLAKPVLSDGTMDSGADAFYVVDPMPDGEGMFYGLAAYTDTNTAAAVHTGYRGFAIKFTEDWDETEVPGWRIITMEGPATQLIVSLAASYSISGTQCQMIAGDGGPWCEPFGGRLPLIEDDAYDVIVDDDLDMTKGGTVGGAEDDVWWIHWDRADEKYVFWRAKDQDIYHVIKGTTSGALTRASTDFTLSDPVAVNGAVPTGTINVKCDPKVNAPAGSTMYARYDVTKDATDENERWSTADAGNFVWHLRALADGYTGTQIIEHVSDADPHWAETGPCDEE